MTNNHIPLMAGPCAVESRNQMLSMGYNISSMRDIIGPDYEIIFELRGGCWKPRTRYFNGDGEKIFEGTREEGLEWLAETADRYSLPVVSEVMSEMDLRHFERLLDPNRDVLQIGARTSQAFALLYNVGGTRFGAMIKSPQHGVNVREAIGSLERLKNNRVRMYCVRGQQIPNPSGDPEFYAKWMDELYSIPDQYKDARNINNIDSISRLREDPYFEDVLLIHDPSHTWGGKTDLMRKKIGEYAIRAIRDYGYDGIIIEVYDRSRHAICDASQALLTTTNGIDWSETYVKEKPETLPITLVDIVCELMEHQSHRLGIPEEKLETDTERLRKGIRWDMTDPY